MKIDICDICGKEITPRELVVDLNITDKEGFMIGFTSDWFYHTDIDICEECGKKLGLYDTDTRVTNLRKAVVDGLKELAKGKEEAK